MLIVPGRVRQLDAKTNPVGIALMVVGKVGRSPAVDWRADVLVGADDDGEDDEEEHRVTVV